MGNGPRQLPVGTVVGALVGVAAFFMVGLLRFGAGDDLVLALAWGLAALVGLIMLGRVVDAALWSPALLTLAEEPAHESPGEQAGSGEEADELRGANLDVAVDDDTDVLTGTGAEGERVDVPKAA